MPGTTGDWANPENTLKTKMAVPPERGQASAICNSS
jgi:hypothetical protein